MEVVCKFPLSKGKLASSEGLEAGEHVTLCNTIQCTIT